MNIYNQEWEGNLLVKWNLVKPSGQAGRTHRCWGETSQHSWFGERCDTDTKVKTLKKLTGPKTLVQPLENPATTRYSLVLPVQPNEAAHR